jgi:hypothetical protein
VARVETLEETPPVHPRKRRLRLAHEQAPTTYTAHVMTVTRLQLWSVAKIAVVFWTCVGVLLTGATLTTWAVLSAAGVIDNFERFVADMTGVEDFRILSGTIVGAFVLLICLFVLVATTVTLIAAEFYNVVAAVLGGVRFVADERQQIEVVETVVDVAGAEPVVETPASNGHADGAVVL